jgi:hypothetical protein
VIPGVLAYAAGADWSRLEFLLLSDSRHDIACAEVGLDWLDMGVEGKEVLVGWSFQGRGEALCRE